MRKTFTVVVVFVAFMLAGVSAFSAPTQEQIDQAIQKGLAWLATQQNTTHGYFGSDYLLGNTAAAVLAFEDEGHFPGGGTEYSDEVEKGLDYIFSKAQIIEISEQPAGDPDSDGDGQGVYFDYGHPGYETGMCLMAIVASNTPDRVVTTGPCAGWTYHEVAEDVVDFFAFGQADANWGNQRGGWRYLPNGGSDNSAAQWPVLGMIAAEQWGIYAPDWVKDELQYWVNYSQNANGGGGYTSPWEMVNMAKTGALLVQMYWLGDEKDTPRVQKAISYIDNQSRWEEAPNNTWYGNKGHPYVMFAVYKGLALMRVSRLSFETDFDWWSDYAQWLVDNQKSDGHWDGYTGYFNRWITTGWYIVILMSTIFPAEVIVEVPGCTFDKAGYDVEVTYTVQRFEVDGTVKIYKDDDPDPVKTIELEDFQGSDTYTHHVAEDTPGTHVWRAELEVVAHRELGEDVTVKDTDEDSINVLESPVVGDIPNQNAPFTPFDLDDYLTAGDPDIITWSFTMVQAEPETGWTVNIDEGNVVTVSAPQGVNASATITFTATATCDSEASASDSDDATFTSYPPIVDLPDSVTFPEDGSDSSIDLDDYVADFDHTDAELVWTFTGNTNIHVDIDPETHVVTFTADPNWSGSEVITFTATDPRGLSGSDTITVTVIPVLDILSVTYDVLNTTLTIEFDVPVQPNLITNFDGMDMEVEDSGKADFELSNEQNPRVLQTEPDTTIDIYIRHSYPTTLNLALAALMTHQKVDLVLAGGVFTDIYGNQNDPVLGTDDLEIQFITDGIVLGKVGDANGDGKVTSVDAMYILKASIEGPEVCPAYPAASKVSKWLKDQKVTYDVMLGMIDVTGNGTVSAYDAAIVLQISAGLVPELAPIADAGPKKCMLSASEYRDGKLEVSIDLDNPGGVYSADIVVSFDPRKLSALDVSCADPISGWLSEYSAESGRLRILLAGASQPTSGGQLVTISFSAVSMDAIKDLNILEVKLNDGMLRTSIENLPKAFLAMQNYPNPFNPDTWIPYQLSEPAEVFITIYNANGQVVRHLDLGTKLPGYYIDKSRAAYWDGRNESGEAVSSGIYFYQLRAGKNVSVKKMIVMK